MELRTDAFEIIGDPDHQRRLIVTCEHASNRVPPPMWTPPEDQPLIDDHWGWDPGAADVARALIEDRGGVGVLSRFSRLVCDPNREPSEFDWIRAECEGQQVALNANIDDAERDRRKRLYYDPYHAAIDACLRERLSHPGDVVLFSVHSFTPNYMGERRTIEMGVLFDRFEPVAQRMQAALQAEGFHTALNEPYDGMKGCMFAAHRHGNHHDVVYLELEVRQDLIDTPAKARAVGLKVSRALGQLRVRSQPRA